MVAGVAPPSWAASFSSSRCTCSQQQGKEWSRDVCGASVRGGGAVAVDNQQLRCALCWLAESECLAAWAHM